MDMFQRKSVTLAVAGVFGGLLATGAQAYVVEAPASLTGATVVRLSGASAQDLGLRNVLRRLCLPGTMTQYNISNQNAYVCKPNTSQVSGINGNLVVYKTSVGGSGTGVGPVASAQNLEFLDIPTMFAGNMAAFCPNAPIVTPATAAVAPDTIGLPEFRRVNCAANAPRSNGVADAGLSDTEPALLGATATQIAALNSRGTNQLVFGIPVTLTMYRGLQLAQGLGQDDTAANVPSLSRAQIANIFTGAIVDASQLTDPAGNPLPAQPLVVSRRVSTSGSQSITEVFFLNGRCTPTAQAFSAGDAEYRTDADAFAGCRDAVLTDPFHARNSGTTQVWQCLKGADVSGRWGIGNISTETVPSLTASDGQFRYIKVDGYAPTILNAALGKYLFVAEQSMQWLNSFTEVSAGARFRVANYVRTNLGNPVVIQSVNGDFNQLFGQAGLLGVPDGVTNFPPAAPLTEAAMIATPVNTWSKSFSGALSNCQAPTIVNAQQTFPN